MAINMALKRARKAAKRKLVVSQKRKTEELEGSLSARVLRAAQAPIQHCLLTESLFDGGMGTLIVARGATPLRAIVRRQSSRRPSSRPRSPRRE